MKLIIALALANLLAAVIVVAVLSSPEEMASAMHKVWR